MKTPQLSALLVCYSMSLAAVNIQVQATQGIKPISPYIYGRNYSISDNASNPTPADSIARVRDTGLKILRLSGGNNQTKYHWRKKLSSHPDWYNNVYAHDWDFSAREIANRLSGVSALFSLQLIGWAASNTNNNWDDWGWRQSHNGSYPDPSFNLAGGGVVSADGSTLVKAGNSALYLERWPADSVVGILDHWFGTGAGQLGLDRSRFKYWNMDNEPDIWSATHDDIITAKQPFEDFFAKYVAVAKAARAKWPDIQLVGPVFTNEWQWWTWEGQVFTVNNSKMSAMEYFIMRIGQEEAASGKRLLDVFDLHFYPVYNTAADNAKLLQVHRIFGDTTYRWPDANGIHMIDGLWGQAVPYYLFTRIQNWMEKYLGAGRGRIAMTEFGAVNGDGSASIHAVTYASILGTFANLGVEIFTPWDWYSGWYEVVHLFSKHAKSRRVLSVSSQDSLVSAYSSINQNGDSLTIILINRDQVNAQTANVTISGFTPSQGNAPTYRLANLNGETFISATQNALTSGTQTISGNTFSISLPKLSITAIKLIAANPVIIQQNIAAHPPTIRVSGRRLHIERLASSTQPYSVKLYSAQGSPLLSWTIPAGITQWDTNLENLTRGAYYIRIEQHAPQSVLLY